jgi:hypothetical protein
MKRIGRNYSMRRLGRYAVLLIAATSLGTFGAGLAASTAFATSTGASSTCVDHTTNGGGNLGDPGDGQNHHNESNGGGNTGDPGNAGTKACPNE